MNSSNNLMNHGSDHSDLHHHENHHSYVRKRTRATAEQLAVLEDTFAVNVSPNSKLRKQLAEQLNMSERSIQIWFQNRRAKVKHLQKRAQMQMQQAAIRAQLYHYHQQQYGMMSPFGVGPPPPMMPLQPPLYLNHQQPQQQPFYFPPPYMRRMPVPRARSVDAVSYYSNQSAANMVARSSFPTPGPEPFMSESSTSPPHMTHQQQHYPMSSGGSWSVSPNYHPMDSPIKMSRQSMPPYNPLSHTLVDYIMPTSHTEFGSGAGATPSKQMLSDEDFPDFIHGQISPSPSPNRDEFNSNSASYFSPLCASASLQTPSLIVDTKTGESFNKETLTEEPTAITESEMWKSSPNVEYRSESLNTTSTTSAITAPIPAIASNNSSSEETSSLIATINPSNFIMDGSTAPLDEDFSNCQYFNATALIIGTWHRLKLYSTDLLCLYKADQNCFMWSIIEGGCRFKVEIPVSSMASIEYTPCVGNNGESASDIHFYMSHPPLFYMESSNENNESQWIQCSDFTENKQASRYLRHTLKGAVQLKQDLMNLINEHEDLRKLARFLEPNNNQQRHHSNTSTSFLPSQQQKQSMVVPSASYYPYYCYPTGVSFSAQMPISVALNNNNPVVNHPSSMMTSTEPPVTCGGFYP